VYCYDNCAELEILISICEGFLQIKRRNKTASKVEKVSN
jgi:hypothetical protein